MLPCCKKVNIWRIYGWDFWARNPKPYWFLYIVLPYYMIPSDKHNLIMAKATGLISSLFNIVMCIFTNHSSFNACIMELTFCSPLHSIPFSTITQVTISAMCIMASVRDLGKCSASRGTSCTILCLKCVWSSWKRREMIHRGRATHTLSNQ